ncbi:MAG: entericidin A/B family lipoprotein [Pseudomonadota bacterium]
MLKKIALIAIVATSMTISGCNTIEGIGKDVKSAGTAVEKEAK